MTAACDGFPIGATEIRSEGEAVKSSDGGTTDVPYRPTVPSAPVF